MPELEDVGPIAPAANDPHRSSKLETDAFVVTKYSIAVYFNSDNLLP